MRQRLFRHSAAAKRTAQTNESRMDEMVEAAMTQRADLAERSRTAGGGKSAGGPSPRRFSAKRKLRAVSRLMRGASPSSPAGRFHTCERSQTTQRRAGARHSAPARVAFRFSPLRLRRGRSTFRGSILCPRVPMSTHRRHPRGYPRITRARRDWPDLQRTEPTSAATCRSPGAQRRFDPGSVPSASLTPAETLSANSNARKARYFKGS